MYPPWLESWMKSKCPCLVSWSLSCFSHAFSSYHCIIQSSACDWSNPSVAPVGQCVKMPHHQGIPLKRQQRVSYGERKQLEDVSYLVDILFVYMQFSLLRLLFLTRIELDCLQRLHQPLGHRWASCPSKHGTVVLCIARACCKGRIRTVVVQPLHSVEVHVLVKFTTCRKRKEALGWNDRTLSTPHSLSTHTLSTLTHAQTHNTLP